MDKYLGSRPNVSPACVVNLETVFGGISDDEGTTPGSQIDMEDADSNTATPSKLGESEEDPFLTGTRHKPGKKKRKVRDPNEGTTKMLEALKEHWEEEKDVLQEANNNDKESNTQLLAELKASNDIG